MHSISITWPNAHECTLSRRRSRVRPTGPTKPSIQLTQLSEYLPYLYVQLYRGLEYRLNYGRIRRLASSELLSEIREIKERLAKLESMLRYIIERNIEEAEPFPDEVEAIRSDDELIDLNEIKQRLLRNK